MSYDKCVRCGSCITFCPMFDAVGEEQFSPRGKIYLLQVMESIEDNEELAKEFRRLLFQCSLCGRCEEICSSGVDLLEIWHKQRAKALSDAPEEFEYIDALKKSLANVYNIYGLPPDDRAIYWLDELEDEIPELEDKIYEPGKTAEHIVFLGCLMSFRSSQLDVLRALFKTLEKFDVDYLVMGAEEFCCGHPLHLAGEDDAAHQLQQHNKTIIDSTGAGTVITCCPGCLMQLSTNHDFKEANAVHHTQFFDKLLKTIPSYEEKDDFTYHDPCELHRLCNVKKAPRSLLHKMGVEFREMDLSCCGGGGLLRLTDPDLSDKVIQLRAKREKLADSTVITCCPACREQLLGNNLETLDIVELVEKATKEAEL